MVAEIGVNFVPFGGAIKLIRMGAAVKGLGVRVEAIHGALDPIAAGRRTTAALDTVDGTRVLAAGGRDLSPAQRALMAPGRRRRSCLVHMRK